MIVRISCFNDHRCSTKRLASQSNNSGCDGDSPSKPKLFGVRTSPWLNNFSHTRLTITRGVSGLSWLAIHFANSMRPLPVAIGACLPRERTSASAAARSFPAGRTARRYGPARRRFPEISLPAYLPLERRGPLAWRATTPVCNFSRSCSSCSTLLLTQRRSSRDYLPLSRQMRWLWLYRRSRHPSAACLSRSIRATCDSRFSHLLLRNQRNVHRNRR